MHRGGEKFNLFSARSGFTSQIFTGEVSGVDSAGALGQGVLELSYILVRKIAECNVCSIGIIEYNRNQISK